MKALDDQILDIERLDQFRKRAIKLRREAITALTTHVYEPRRRGQPPAKDSKPQDWAAPGDDIEKAEILRALTQIVPSGKENRERRKESKEKLIEDLTAITYVDCVKASTPDAPYAALDRIPIFRCALVLQALVETPGQALSKSAFACLYCIIQELNEVAGPTWVSGAARATTVASPTAFVTAECARGILALETSLLQTAKMVELLGVEVNRQSKLRSEYRVWHDQEELFRTASLKASLAALRPSLIVDGDNKDDAKELLNCVESCLNGLSEDVFKDLPRGKLSEAKPDEAILSIAQSHFTETAKDIAWNAVNRLCKILQRPISDGDEQKRAKAIAENLRDAARVLREILEPLEQFAESIIDRQLAAGTAPLAMPVDGAELLFAANLLGLVSDWGKPKIKAAYEILRPMLSVNGRLPTLRPFDVDESGYRLNVQTMEITRRLADLIANSDVELEPQFVERMMRPFEDGRVKGEIESDCGWTIDAPGRARQSLWWMTALVADALESVIRMLDQAINRQVRAQFQWRDPSDLKLSLDDLFYPDYGLVASKLHDDPEAEAESVAVKLQNLREHAAYGQEKRKPYSLVLYGPPGTGKTTLVEALAKSAGVPLIEITPSDILVGGEEAIERRTRHVFQALSKLTHAVILFDEFDPILQDRGKRDASQLAKSIFEFLTPGMLPKLKALHEAADEQRVSYVLATNFVYDLDPAVIRKGRFDDRCGIYPPDAISRRGRLLDQLKKMKHEQGNGAALNEEQQTRLEAILSNTARGPMEQLAKPGWFTRPVFGYIFDERSKPGKVEPETTYASERKKYDHRRKKMKEANNASSLPEQSEPEEMYWDDWRRIEAWEQKVESGNVEWDKLHEIVPPAEPSSSS